MTEFKDNCPTTSTSEYATRGSFKSKETMQGRRFLRAYLRDVQKTWIYVFKFDPYPN